MTMKPNGKTFAVRMVLFAVCAVCLLSDLSKAETVRGTFKLPVAAHWGTMVLEPGEYQFSIDTASATRMLVVHSTTSSFTGMVLNSTIADMGTAKGSTLALSKVEDATYVEALYLPDAGIALKFGVPTKLARPSKPTTMAASGTH
jgi:hypothetical protein